VNFVTWSDSMRQPALQALLIVAIAAFVGAAHSQQIDSSFADMSVPGNWSPAKQFSPGNAGTDIYFDSATGALLLIRQQAGLQKVGDIAKFFSGTSGGNRDAASTMSEGTFVLPVPFTERAAKELGKGSKPPKMWDLKDGDGNALWFYVSQLFEDYRVKDVGGASQVSEQFQPVRVVKAEQAAVPGGAVLLFEVETEKPANDAALKRFHMPPAFKDQKLRYGWVQFAPGGIAAGQGVLSVGYAVGANSPLTIDDVAKQVAAAKIKQL
jgi:hypothetical protein